MIVSLAQYICLLFYGSFLLIHTLIIFASSENSFLQYFDNNSRIKCKLKTKFLRGFLVCIKSSIIAAIFFFTISNFVSYRKTLFPSSGNLFLQYLYIRSRRICLLNNPSVEDFLFVVRVSFLQQYFFNE